MINKLNKLLLLVIVGLVFGVVQTIYAAEGDIQITPSSQQVGSGQDFDIEVRLDTGGKDLGAFNLYLDFDPAMVALDLAEGDIVTDGNRGLSKGTHTDGYTMLLNVNDIASGHYRFAGITAAGFANGNNVHLVTIHAHATAMFTAGTSALTLRVDELSDELGHPLTVGSSTGATILSSDTPTDVALSTNAIEGNQINSATMLGIALVTLLLTFTALFLWRHKA